MFSSDDMNEMNMQWGWHNNLWALFPKAELLLKILFKLHSQQNASVIKPIT
jgi:hypothetical protein